MCVNPCLVTFRIRRRLRKLHAHRTTVRTFLRLFKPPKYRLSLIAIHWQLSTHVVLASNLNRLHLASAWHRRPVDSPKLDAPLYDPKAARFRGKLWTKISAPGMAPRLVIFWPRIALALLILAVVGWLLLAASVYTFVRIRHDFRQASYLNLVWPLNWPKHREALGRNYIERGRAALDAQDYASAASFYSAGLARVPRDITARRELATLYLRLGHIQPSINLLQRGLSHALHDLDYLRLTFNLLSETRADAEILELVKRYLPEQPTQNLQHYFLALQAAQAHYQRGNYDAAEKIVHDWNLTRSSEGEILMARSDWERGYTHLAVARLERARAASPGRDDFSLQLIRFYRDLGRQDSALNEALLRHVTNPHSPGARVDLIYSFHHKNDQVRYTRELDSYLADYRENPQAITLLAWFAADTGELTLARRLHALAVEQKFPTPVFDLVILQALIFRGDYRAALEASELALQSPAAQDQRFAAVLSGLRALAAFGVGDPANGELYLKTFLIREHLRASDATLLAERLEEIGARNQARLVLTTAVSKDPANQAALTALVKLEIADNNLSALEKYLPPLLGMRKPARTVLQEAYLKLDDSTASRAALRQSITTALETTPVLPAPRG
jgi:hypothetical protein